MDSWKNIILQWVNCLHDDINDYIKNIIELEDGKIYYKLIKKIRSWNQKENNANWKEIVYQFIKDEYPYIIFNDKSIIKNLYIAILVLSRLSLEPIFHKSLCNKLPLDMQIKIKSILESMYTFGKDLTIEDLCQIMSISDKTDIKSIIKPKYLLEEFLNSPVIRSVHSDNKIYEQTKQLRTLRARVETLYYEKSELIEDIKVQQNQIRDLENKLQKALLDLKIAPEDNSKINNLDCSGQVQNVKLMQSTYEKEVQSLEKYIAELQDDNSKLQDEKNDLINKIHSYKTQCCMLKERNISNEQLIESNILQIEKKEEELIDLRIKYEELCKYLKEKYKMYIYNESFDQDDKGIFNMSLNKSETLSTVIEIQLQDTKKELFIMQNKFQTVNTLLTIIMEEYKKLKEKTDILCSDNIELQEVYKLQKKQIQNADNILNEKHDYIKIRNHSYINKLKNNNFLPNKIQVFINIFQNDLTKENKKFLFLDLLNIFDNFKSSKKLKNNIVFQLNQGKNVSNSFINSDNLWKIKEMFIKAIYSNTFQTFQNDKENFNQTISSINFLNKIKKLIVIITEKNLFNIVSNFKNINVESFLKLLDFVQNYFGININLLNEKTCSWKGNIQNNYRFNKITYTQFIYNKINIIYIVPYIIKKNTVKYNISNIKCTRLALLSSQCSLKLLQSSWIFLFESIYSNFKIYKVLLLLEKEWLFTLEILKDILYYNSKTKPKLKQILIKKDIIENELKNINFENFRILFLKFIAIIQFVIILSNKYYYEMKFYDDKLLNINLNDRIINIKKKMNSFNNLLELYQRKFTKNRMSTIIHEVKKNKNINLLIAVNENKMIKFKGDSTAFKDNNIHYFNKSLNDDVNYQFQHSLKEIHKKYEFKLEKMKEKMKFVYNNQINMIKKEQEIITKTQLEAVESKIKYQCYNHTEELKKYKKHISELTKQLWHVGDKLINEKQEKEDMIKKFQDLKTNCERQNFRNKKYIDRELNNYNHSSIQSEADHIMQSVESNFVNKMHALRGFQIMGNAFNIEDEEGEVFDTTYLSDMQKSESISSTHDVNRLSILQMRNAKCKPHLKSSYPAELQFHSIPFTEDEIKTGSVSEDLFNDSLSQSLLTDKKIKRKDRTRNMTDTPRRSRRFSNIFRRHR